MDTDIIEYLSSMSTEVDVVVIDNIGVMAINHDIREFADEFSSISIILLKNGCTSLFVMDEDSYKYYPEAYGLYGFRAYETHYTGKLISGKTKQYLYIEKMRNTPVPVKYSLFDITSQGIRVISGMKSP